MESIQERLGRAIYDYFLQRTSPNESFRLLVDSYTYEHCARQAKLTDKDIEKLLKGEGFYSCNSLYSSLAIASLEVKIAYDVETDTDLVNSYNRRLIEKIKYCYDDNSVQQLYRDCDQEAIWEKVKLLFKKANRNLIIPAPKTGKGRYVQFPLEQRIVSGTTIIKYADRFIDLHLEPNSGITYTLFSKLVFNYNDFSGNQNLRRMVFSFYCVWDGRSYREIYNRTRKSVEQQEQQAKEEFLIKLQPETQFYINKKPIDLKKNKIADKYLWKFGDNKYLTRKGSIFIQDTDYKDWLPNYRKTIDDDDDVLLISEQTNFPKYINDLIEEGKIEISDAESYKILLLSSFSRADFELLGIPLKPIPYFSLVGGLKIKRNTYYDFAPPAIRLNDIVENKDDYKSVYVDTEKYPVQDGIATISKQLKVGKHCIKLLNSWDSSEIYFNIENVNAAEISDNHGWTLSFAECIVLPFVQESEKVIDGQKCCAELNWIERKHKIQGNGSLRMFQRQNEKLLDRYNQIGNLKLSRRAYYGN